MTKMTRKTFENHEKYKKTLISNRFSCHCDLFLKKKNVFLSGMLKCTLNLHNDARLIEISERISLK